MLSNLNKKSFWRWRNRRKNVSFRLKKYVFNFKRDMHERGNGFKRNIHLVKNILKDIVYSLIFIVAIVILEQLFLEELIVKSEIGIVKDLTNILSFNNDTFVTLVGTFASIIGVFLGLYFSSMGSLIGSTYAKLPKELSIVFENEKIGNRYIRSLMKYIIICLLLLFLENIGLESGYLMSFSITIYGCISVMNFFNLGKFIYKYSDYTEISGIISEEVHKFMKLSSVEGIAWDDVNFQNHYNSYCSGQIQLLKKLVTVIRSDKDIGVGSIEKVFTNLFHVLYFYQKDYKSKIPAKSLWFGKINKHKSWFTESFTTLLIVLNTRSFIHSKEEVNTTWIEDELFTMIYTLLEKIAFRKDYRVLSNCLGVIGNSINVLLSNLDFRSTIAFLQNVNSKLMMNILDDIPAYDNHRGEVHVTIGCLEAIASIYSAVVVTANNTLHLFNENEIDKIIENNGWFKEEYILRSKLPSSLIQRIDGFREKIVFDNKVDSNQFLPKWYSKQLFATVYMDELDVITNSIMSISKSEYVEKATFYFDNKKFFASYIYICQGITYLARLEYYLVGLEKVNESLNGVMVEDLIKAKKINLEELKKRMQDDREALVIKMAELTLIFATKKRGVGFPDFFGHGYNYMYEFCLDSLLKGDFDFFEKLYDYILNLSIFTREKIYSDMIEESNEYYSRLTSLNSNVDFLFINGVAIYISELLDKPELMEFITDKTENVFRLLNDKTGSNICLEYIEILTMLRNGLDMSQRTHIRFQWSERINSFITESGLIMEEYNGTRFYHKKVMHKSALVKSFSYDIHIRIPFDEIFVVLVLNDYVKEDKKYKTQYGWERRYLEYIEKEGADDNPR